MQTLSKRFVFLCSAILLATARAYGGVVYDNGGPDSTDGYGMTHWMQADDFAAAQPVRLEGMTFWNNQVGTGQFNDSQHSHDWFIVRIYADSGNNAPGALLFDGFSTNLNRTLVASGSYPQYVNSFSFASTPDGAPTSVDISGGTYWVALHNGPFSNDITVLSTPTGPIYLEVFFWTATTQVHGSRSEDLQAPYNGGWNSNACPTCTPKVPNSELAFQLSGAFLPGITAFQRSGGTPQVSFTTEGGRNYRVDYSNTLPQPAWQPVSGGENVSGTGGVVTISDPNANGVPRRYYRVVLL